MGEFVVERHVRTRETRTRMHFDAKFSGFAMQRDDGDESRDVKSRETKRVESRGDEETKRWTESMRVNREESQKLREEESRETRGKRREAYLTYLLL